MECGYSVGTMWKARVGKVPPTQGKPVKVTYSASTDAEIRTAYGSLGLSFSCLTALAGMSRVSSAAILEK